MFEFLVLRVREDIQQIDIPRHATRVFRRAAPGSVDEAGILDSLDSFNHTFQFDCVLPAITEIVLIANLRPGSWQNFGETNLAFRDDIARLIVGWVRVSSVSFPVGA